MNEPNRTTAQNPLGSAPLMPLIARFAIPSIISMLVGAAYNITDQIFIGHVVGMLGNAATNVTFPTMTFTTAMSMLVGIGTAANFSMNQGAGKMEEARKHVHTGLATVVILGVLTGLFVFLFRSQIIVLCGAERSGNVFPYAYQYLSITALGLPFHIITHTSSMLIRADGKPTYSMLCTTTGVIINVFLDWLFMFPLGMGIRGAAIATVIGQFISFIMAVTYYPHFRAFDIRFRDLGISPHHLWLNIQAGTPNFISHILMMSTNIVLNNMLATYGALSVYGSDIPLAVSGIAQKTAMIMISFAVGIAQGCQPIWGFNLGAKNYARVRGAFWRAFAAAFTVGLIFFFALQLFPREIISIFGTGSDLYFEFAEKYLKIYMMLVFFQNIQPIAINYFSATGNHRLGTIVSLSRQGLCLIPLLVIMPKFMGIDGVLWASPIADLIAFVLSMSMVLVTFRRYR